MKASEERKYESLSPFELKNKLIDLAKTNQEKIMLNAGRGNPNWIATEPRHAFMELMHFALLEAERNMIRPKFGRIVEKKGIFERFQEYLKTHQKILGIDILGEMLAHVKNVLNYEPDEFVFEMTDAILGDHYPEPDRILPFCEKIVNEYLSVEMFCNGGSNTNLDLFATEGGTAAMDYIFSSLIENKILQKGDTIALGTPIFTPYLEIPVLNDYEFKIVEIKQNEKNNWQYDDSELEKLADPKIKAFFIVNPANPTSARISEVNMDKIAEIIKTKNRELIILTDDVYGTFVNGFKSLFCVCPHNTILVYSFSKYFGATGWRLGVIGINEKNIFDEKISKLSHKDKELLKKRYGSVVLKPEEMKFIDRLVADSRAVALNHTAGLSTPQQVQMTLFALYCLMDNENLYKKTAQEIVLNRYKLLLKSLGVEYVPNQHNTHYYTTIDIPSLAKERYGDKFENWLTKKHEPIDFVVRLAEEKSVILMDGGGFDAPEMSVRVSLANLNDADYEKIGKAITELLEEYHKEFNKD